VDELTAGYYRYWGKAAEDGSYHLLPYHCLDVAAVGKYWWEQSPSLRLQISQQLGLSEDVALAWIMFFLAMHDFGKFDVRFQSKVQQVCNKLFPFNLPGQLTSDYYHGPKGFMWLAQELREYLGQDELRPSQRKPYQHWVAQVAGHHGQIPTDPSLSIPLFVPPEIVEFDAKARSAWIRTLTRLFLSPQKIELSDIPPVAPNILAGFCSVCDWIGSNQKFFNFQSEPRDLKEYFEERYEIAASAVERLGVISRPLPQGGMDVLFPEYQPRGLQTLVAQLPVHRGLTIIEAPTGSGKTEAALAYASRLLAGGAAESVIFALPTQATTNAMFDRLQVVAERLFKGGRNVVLAHGKRDFVQNFIDLKNVATSSSYGKEQDGLVQCSEWLASSRKRVFLGQIGVCTIDQVLLSVLPVRHNFVRGFGVRKSVLIIDEVHAYDSYMYGLLNRVLEEQYKAGGSAILLSATLPAFQRRQLQKSWGDESEITVSDYPLVTHSGGDCTRFFKLDSQPGIDRIVKVELWPSNKAEFTVEHLEKIVIAAEQGAVVAVICNVVAEAQRVASALSTMTNLTVDLFHSRYRFVDRLAKESVVINDYGPKSKRSRRILVATQVVEQSLDLDFDWMVTHLCPVDLLFQRLGRLHRHDNKRPEGFKSPSCAIIIPPEGSTDFDLHEVIYQNVRALWRTQKKLEGADEIIFPKAYREWIEEVYQEEARDDEPVEIDDKYFIFKIMQRERQNLSDRISSAAITPFADTDENISALTRDGDMSLLVMPVVIDAGKKRCLDGQCLDDLEDWQLPEVVNLQTISVPGTNSWKGSLPQAEQEGIIYLEMTADADKWVATVGQYRFIYTVDRGLEREKL